MKFCQSIPCSKTLFLFCLCGTTALTAPVGLADDIGDEARRELAAGEPYELAVISVADAHDLADERQDFPGLAVSVDAEDIEDLNAFNAEDTIKYLPNLNVRKRYIGDNNATLALRGAHSFMTPRAIVEADGLLLSNFLGARWDTAPRWNVVSAREIESVEIIYGPFLARYSGNAMGGVVRFSTRVPEAFETEGEAHYFENDFDYYGTDDSFDGYKLFGAIGNAVGNAMGDTGSYLFAERLENEGQPQQFRLLRPTGGEADGLNPPVQGAFLDPGLNAPVFAADSPVDVTQDLFKAKVRHRFNEDWRGQFTLALWDDEEELFDPQTYLVDQAGMPVFQGPVSFNGSNFNASGLRLSQSENTDYLLGLNVDGLLGGAWLTELDLSYYEVDDKESRQSNDYLTGINNGAGRLTVQDDASWETLDLRFSRVMGDHQPAAGYHFDQYSTRQSQYNVSQWRTGNDRTLRNRTGGETETQALYVENSWQFAPDWSLYLGGRYEWWEAENGLTSRLVAGREVSGRFPSRDESDFSPKASLTWQISPVWSSTIALAQAHRYPTVGELFQGSLDGNGDFDPNSFDPNLRKESSDEFNWSLTYAQGGTQVILNIFANEVDDTIFRQVGLSPVTGVLTSSFQNIDEMENSGAELVISNQETWLPRLSLDFNVSYTDAEITRNAGVPASEGRQLPRVPEWRVNLFARYRITDALDAALGYRYSDDPLTGLTNAREFDTFSFTTGYSVADFKINYRLGDMARLSFGVDNFTDDRYFVFHPYPGRTWVAGVNLRY